MNKIIDYKIEYNKSPNQFTEIEFKIFVELENNKKLSPITIIKPTQLQFIHEDLIYYTLYPLICNEICTDINCDDGIYKNTVFRDQLHKIIEKELGMEENNKC